ncbi:MAG: DAK2 domain-containing protein [Ruminococcaceae bacterium]|nr:DAK2 domain-containing protein [Oscillospiraceae bacterium]
MFKSDKSKKKKKGEDAKGLKYLGGMLLSKMAAGGAALLRRNAEKVNNLNVFPVPDGDTGDNMRMTIESGIAALETLETDDIAEVMKVLSHGMLLGARGNSGVILSQFFAGTYKGLDGVEKADPQALGKALEKGVEQAYGSVMTPTEGTILTVAREAVEYANSRINEASTIRSYFADLAREMHDSLERTPELLSTLKEAGVVDSGGAGLFYIIDGFNRVLNGEEIEGGDAPAPKASTVLNTSFNADSEMTYGYCTEALLQLQNKKCDPEKFDVDALKVFLSAIGDSVVAFKTESIVKLHVHTLTPEKVLEHCRKYGEFLTVKIENMSVQHTDLENGEKQAEPATPPKPKEKKKYAVVAVCNGEGVEDLYRELGADEIIYGGQTHNPSTNEFLDAFSRIYAEHIFVFPNNGNVLMAAQQAADIYKDAAVHVLASKNIGMGYVALSTADFSCEDAAMIEQGMKEAMQSIISGYVSPSIRDADLNGVHIKNGDTIGIIEKEVVVSSQNRLEAAHVLASLMLEGRYMLTVFCGKEADEMEQMALTEILAEARPDAEIYFIPAGQDIYPYIFVAE